MLNSSSRFSIEEYLSNLPPDALRGDVPVLIYDQDSPICMHWMEPLLEMANGELEFYPRRPVVDGFGDLAEKEIQGKIIRECMLCD